MLNKDAIAGRLGRMPGLRSLREGLLRAPRHADLVLAFVVVAVIALMILPLPPLALDGLIAVNLGLSVTLLMVSLYLRQAATLYTFPALLLLTTLFRLSLGIATTRQILLHAYAGEIIETFGNVVVAGNFIVGGVIFAIITIVQFLVITKGSERVAEVSARFSLDAMPGKQMSIDADVRAGAIDMETARARRGALERESQFYGAMDGAMKFVKGDAIAGMVTIAVNILGGVCIGTLQMGMPLAEALQTYAVLTIGDGLITQIPALFVSITAGIIVTKVSSEDSVHLGGDIGAQLLASPRALLIGGGIIAGFCLMPGFPKLPFLLLGALVGSLGYLLQAESGERGLPGPADPAAAAGEAPAGLPHPLMAELHASLAPHADAARLRERLETLRFQLEQETGIAFPPFHIRFSDPIEDGGYVLHLYEVPMGGGRWRPEPAGGATAASSGEEACRALVAHAGRLLRKHASAFLGLQETKKLLDRAEGHLDAVVKEAVRSLPLSRIAEVLQRLAREGVPVRNLKAILESLVEWAPKEKDVALLAEYVRLALGRHICHHYSGGTQVLSACVLDAEMEALVRQSVKLTPAGPFLSLPPGTAEKLVRMLQGELGRVTGSRSAVILTSLDIRRHLKGLLDAALADVPVLSFQELPPETVIRTLARVGIPLSVEA